MWRIITNAGLNEMHQFDVMKCLKENSAKHA